MTVANPIIPAEDLILLTDAARVRKEAEAVLAKAKDEAIRLKASAKVEGRAEGLAEGSAAAAEILADARAHATQQANSLEDTLASLVAEAVRNIIGKGNRDKTVRAAVRTALQRLGTEATARLHIAADMAKPVRDAMADIKTDLPLVIDETLPDGTVLLSGPEGHAHIGLEAQLDAGLATFEAPK